MNKTSRSSRLVRSAARSPALAMTGPAVERKLTPSSRATIWASVVLPSPGGPTNSTWSRASPRALADSMKTLRFLRAASWPVKSARTCGRRAVSSSGRFSAETRRRGASAIRQPPPAAPDPAAAASSGSLRQLLQARPDQRRRLRLAAEGSRAPGNGRRGLGAGEAKADQGEDGVVGGLRQFRPAFDAHVGCAKVGSAGRRRLVLQLEHQPRGEFGADAGGARHHRLVLPGNRGRKRVCRQRAENAEGDLGAHALDALQHAEPVALCRGEKTVEPDRVLTNMGFNQQLHLLD